MEIVGLDHVQLAMSAGGEGQASRFYRDLLGFVEIEKPVELQARGGRWFQVNRVQVHLGVQADFMPAKKAHPAFLAADLPALAKKLSDAGVNFQFDETVPGKLRGHCFDPFGNRIELIQQGDGFLEAYDD